MPIESKHWGFMSGSLCHLPHPKHHYRSPSLQILSLKAISRPVTIVVIWVVPLDTTNTLHQQREAHDVQDPNLLLILGGGREFRTMSIKLMPYETKLDLESLCRDDQDGSFLFTPSLEPIESRSGDAVPGKHNSLLDWTNVVINICDASVNESWVQKSMVKRPTGPETLCLTCYFPVPPYLSLPFLAVSATAKQEGR